MYRLLLVSNEPIITIAFAHLVKKVIENVDQHLTNSITNIQHIQNVNDYDMFVIVLPFNQPTPVGELLDIARLYPRKAIVLMVENMKKMPLHTLYNAGIYSIVDKQTSITELQQIIKKASTGNTVQAKANSI